TVYVKGYNDNGSQISGVYAIPAGKTIEVAGASHTVPNKQSYTIWGGVYLSTVPKGNTDYESNGNNNASNFTCKTKAAIRITAIEPNASYRENTEVISSYYVWNDSTGDILPSHNVTVKLRIYKPGSTSPYLTLSKAVVVPKGDKNIVYFKWKVPEKLNGKDMTLKADVIISGTSFANISNSRSTVSYFNSVTPDTRYEESAPKGFIGPATPSETTGSASWSEYIYSGGKFVKKDYKVTILKSTNNLITPATGKTAEKVNGQWVMKSGYGFSLKSLVYMQTVNGSNTADESAYTIPQYAYVLYPEYYYKQNNNEYTTLELINNTTSKYFALPNNIEYGRVHFIPLWYPNGKYSVKVVQSDCWTPVGMITKAIVPNTFKIDGNAYDDWYERG
ncbi:MAG: hypothetical protein IJS94_01300, partial [Clostridia bacterium]|nr:hypothetical protein [Clostridia bacterium]